MTALANRDAILHAAFKLAEEGGLGAPTFPIETLIVRAWRMYPLAFGLRGYTDQHPNANRVLAKVMGADGLVARGHLNADGLCRYSVTDAGRRRIAERGLA